jgi:DNA-binding MarR family transcriptional regulator
VPDTATRSEIADRLRVAIGRLGRYLRLTHHDTDLSPSQREVLTAVARAGVVSSGDLAAGEGLNPTMVSRIVAKLEAAGLVERSSGGTDARVVHVAATAKGRRLCQTMRDERTDALAEAVDALAPTERRKLTEALGAIESIVEHLREGK